MSTKTVPATSLNPGHIRHSVLPPQVAAWERVDFHSAGKVAKTCKLHKPPFKSSPSRRLPKMELVGIVSQSNANHCGGSNFWAFLATVDAGLENKFQFLWFSGNNSWAQHLPSLKKSAVLCIPLRYVIVHYNSSV